MKKALVTGASTGIGKEFARQLAAQGYTVTAVARNEKLLKALCKDLTGTGHTYLACDLTDAKMLKRVIDEIKKHHFDLVVNNAGAGSYGYFAENSPEEFKRLVALNISALTEIAWAFLRTAQAGDALVNVSSTLSFLPLPGSAVYAATKSYVTSFSDSIWYENKKRGVYVMALCPGATESEFHTRAGGSEANRPPKGITQSAETVVSVAIKALQKRARCVVIPGMNNKFAQFMSRMLPRKAIVSVMGKFARERHN